MKLGSFHPGSVLIGVALAALLAALTAAAQAPGTKAQIPIRAPRLVGEVPAEWWTIVTLRGANNPPELTYLVPDDRFLVLTNGTNLSGGVLADGDLISPNLGGFSNGTRVVFAPGTLLSVTDGHGTSTVWGYLEPIQR